jgi:hypothetical protein
MTPSRSAWLRELHDALHDPDGRWCDPRQDEGRGPCAVLRALEDAYDGGYQAAAEDHGCVVEAARGRRA